MGGEGSVAVLGEFACDLAGPLIPAGHVVDYDHTRKGTGPQRPCIIGGDVIVVVTADGDRLGKHSFVQGSISLALSSLRRG